MSIWVTRSAPDNASTARRLHAFGSEPLVVPVLQAAAIDHPPLSRRPDAIIFSSKHAVRHHRPPADHARIPVHAAGEAVAAAARALGYRDVTWSGGDDRVLCDTLRYLLPDDDALVAHICSPRTSRFVEDRMAVHGVAVERQEVYAAQRVDALPVHAVAAGVGGILIHSAVAAAAVRPIVVAAGWRGTIWCISAAAAAVFDGVPGVRLSIARQPTEASLLGLVKREAADMGIWPGFANDN